MFQDGPHEAITPASLHKARSSVPGGRIARRAITLPEGSHIPNVFVRPPEPMLACTRGSTRSKIETLNPASKSAPMRFPFNNFTYCLTLFSKCFSSFDHSTCSLSVSGQYLALDGIYHPLGAAFPNNSTRRRGLTRSARSAGYGTLTLCGILFQGTWTVSPSEAPSANYNSEAKGSRFQI